MRNSDRVPSIFSQPARLVVLLRSALVSIALLLVPALHAINVSEPPDFPNSAGAVTATNTYTLTVGSNTFQGSVLMGSGDADYFKVVVPAGMRITQITTSPSGFSASFIVPSVPANAGTYTAGFAPGQILQDISWSIVFTVAAVPDYDVTYNGSSYVVTNNTNHGDTLTVSEPVSGDINFAAPGRTFSINGAPNSTDSTGTLILNGITAITISSGSGNETINVGAFSGSSFPSLTLNGGTGADTVNFNGNITFASNNSLSVDLTTSSDGTVNASGAQLVASGSGAVTIKCSKNVSLSGGAVLQTVDGGIDVEANQQTPATTGNFNGVSLDGSGTKIQMTGTPLVFVTVKGTGGNDPNGYQIGVNLTNGAQIIGSGNSLVTVVGTGGASTGIVNRGVTVYGAGSAVTGGSDFGVTVTGSAGANGSGYGIGVSVLYGGKISAAEGGVTITGTGHGSGDANQGVEIGGAATPTSTITSSGNVSITATPGPGNSVGLVMSDSAAIAPAAAVNIGTDSVSLDSNVTITATYPDEGVAFSTINATHINLGGNDSPGTLGLSATELNDLTGGILSFYSGDIIISAPLVRSSATDLTLIANSGGYHFTASGTDLDLHGGNLYLYAPGSVAMPITGPAPDTGFPQLNVSAGGIYIFADPLDFQSTTTVSLDLTGTTYSGTAGQQFTILKNNTNAPITGTFNGLPEGAYLVWPGDATLAAQITYVGGSGHDVVLTLVPVANALRVTNTADDASVGSLPTTIAFAAAHPGADTITFDPTLGGQTITLTGPANDYAITIGDSAGVTIDASSLPNGLTIQGAGAGGNFGLFNVPNGSSLTLRGLTLANGGGNAFESGGGYGGAIQSKGAVTLVGCTLVGNHAGNGGAILNGGVGTLTLTQCTLSGNSCGSNGGAIYNTGTLMVTQCTLSGNSGFSGGAIINFGNVTLTNSIVAGNSASGGADIFNSAGAISLAGTNIVQSLAGNPPTGSGTIINADPLLVGLGSYGGPTDTMIPKPGSPAIDHGLNSAIPNDPATGLPFTTDQRGFARISNSTVDIGAAETSAFVVTNALDNGNPTSLRQRLQQATDVTTTITFDPSLVGTILLGGSGELSLGRNFAIDASALPGGVVISGGGTSRIFTTNSPTTIVLTNLILTGGNGGGALVNGSAGAIYNNGAALTLNQCTVSNNAATGAGTGNGGIGGAIRNSASLSTGSLTLNRSTVANNAASTTTGSVVGGIACATIPTTLNQCTFTGNSTIGVGGALSVATGGSLAVTQSTIAGNTAGTNGGGINNGGTATITNSIVATNTGSLGADINNSGTVNRAGRNIIGDNNTVTTQFPVGLPNGNGDYVGTTASPVNPLLAPLGSYGGPTFTMALLTGTPAHNAAVNSTFTSDQRGFAITDGHPDIGAYEAGDISNYFAWIYENLPANTASNAADHATTFDFDGDGVTNFNEWIELTNPGDPTSYLHITQTTRSGSNLSITFTSVIGRHYSVEGSTDLHIWTPIDGPLTGAGSPISRSYILPPGTTPKYFVHVLGGP